jgi:hypothetical protein
MMRLKRTNSSEGTPRRGDRAFTLLEVMIAVAIFFMAVFAILGLVSNTLRNARALQRVEADVGMLAGELSLTNKLYEGSDSGDFGDLYPGYSWSREIYEVGSNGLFRVDFFVTHRLGNNTVVAPLSTLMFKPESPPTTGGPRGLQ